jgi:hypothetical protein
MVLEYLIFLKIDFFEDLPKTMSELAQIKSGSRKLAGF